MFFESEEIRNIAITGPYGSGKSSLIKSYFKKRPQYKTLKISLATIEKKDLDLIEKSILQQMFYTVRYKEIPLSRFRKIVRLSSWKVFLITLLLMVLTLTYLYIFVASISDKIDFFFLILFGNYKFQNSFKLLAPFIFSITSLALLYFGIKYFAK